MKKVVLITGASTGIGFATLEKLVEEGFVVYGTARKKQDLDAIERVGGKPLYMEMTDYDSIQKGVNTIMKNEGSIDILCNNAGYGLYGAIEDVPIDAAKHQFEVNLFGLARLTQLVIPTMRKSQSGHIINISSIGGRVWIPFGAWYHATKHALEGWSDCLAYELKPFGIRVTIIEPGAIKTPWGATQQDTLRKYSGSGPYEKLVGMLIKRTERSYKNGDGSDPSVIADVISRAIATKKPKARYLAGKYAKQLWFVRRVLGDSAYSVVVDKLVSR